MNNYFDFIICDILRLGVCRLRCALSQPKTKVEKKTILHELYEQQGQSPWYDNLRRPVSDLKPLIESGVRGITSNPTVLQATHFLNCIGALTIILDSHICLLLFNLFLFCTAEVRK
jgi:hypothetical protein